MNVLTPCIRVSTLSRTASVAGSIAAAVRQQPAVEVQAVGAGAVNQAVKAIALAREYVRQDGFDLVCAPLLRRVEVTEGEERTAVILEVRRWQLSTAT